MHETKQIYYNQVKGVICEINDTPEFPSIVIVVGHENKRHVNLCFKKELMKSVVDNYQIDDFINIKFFVSSRFKHDRWYTMCNGLEIL